MNKFRSAEELDISPELYESLQWVLEQLEKNAFTSAYDGRRSFEPMGFDMSTVTSGPLKPNNPNEYNCGTACCIAGWSAIHMKDIRPEKDGYRINPDVVELGHVLVNSAEGALDRLFMGEFFDAENEGHLEQLVLHRVTPQEAGVALRSFLETGDPHWELACPPDSDARDL